VNELLERIQEELRSAWRFRIIALLVAVSLAVLGWLFIFVLRDQFEANGAVFVDTRTALRPALQNLTVEQDVGVQLNFVRQSLLSGEPLEKLARESGVLTDKVTDPREIADVLTAFSKRVTIEVRSANTRESERDAGSIYSFAYKDGNRMRALRVVEHILDYFVTETLGNKKEGAENAQKFLEEQIRSYESRLRVAENRLAEFKKSNIGLMPTEQGGYFSALQTELDTVRKFESELSVVSSRRAELTRQLRGESIIAATPSVNLGGQSASSPGDVVSRIKETQARLDDLLLRFTDAHPDVIAAKAALAELTRRREVEIQNLRRGDASAVAASGVGATTVYQSIQLQINQADVDAASLNRQIQQHRAKAAELRGRLDTAPKVEAEFAQLNRDYDITKATYTGLLANYEKARLGERADSAGSVRFEIVRPPTSPYAPVSPRRTVLLAAVLALSMLAGAGVAYALHLIAPVVGSAKAMATITDIPVLGIVGSAFPHSARARMRKELLLFSGAAVALVGMLIVAVQLSRMGFRLVLGQG
jgi:polysaccharide chain length determinant protein (PEP-CTERM system associated)